MTEISCACSYDLESENRIESQVAFRNSPAVVRGYGGAMGGGKALDVDTLVPTSDGWKRMGDLIVGDTLFDHLGHPTTVTYAHPVMEGRSCLRLRFDDGAEIVCDDEHLWLTSTFEERNGVRHYAALQPALEIAASLVHRPGRRDVCWNHSIQNVLPLTMPEADLPVDPYVLGVWLGDGHSADGTVTTADAEIPVALAAAGYPVLKRRASYGWGTKGLYRPLRLLGLLNNKHIPAPFLRASFAQRLSLLQGLMDSDGHAKTNGGCEFTTTKRALADGVMELLRTLGVKPVLRTGRATLDGRDISAKYRIVFTTALPAFRLERKLNRQNRLPRPVVSRRYIVAAERVPSRPVRCVTVSAPDGTFLAGEAMVPTHNSRALCEEVFDWMLEYPGIEIPVFRQVHTHITGSTRKTFIEQVLPSELRGRKDLVRIKQSGGEDFIRLLWNNSTVHFVGMDNPGKWFSTEIGAAAFDEAHEISEEHVLLVNSRLRQRCALCLAAGRPDCQHMPYKLVLTFNPSHPQHWLRQWFILGATKIPYGYHKSELVGTKSLDPIGDCDYFVARATDNPFLPPNYVERSLGGFGEIERKRFLDGLWINPASSIFDNDALTRSMEDAAVFQPVQFEVSGGQHVSGCEPAGQLTGADDQDRPRIVGRRNGRMQVFRAPVRWHVTEEGEEVKAHRYVIGIDFSTGMAADWSAIQVVDVEELEQVAEWQGKIDPDKLVEVAFLIACVFNGAMLTPETTGGWGHAGVQRLRRLIADWKGPPKSKPTLYTRPILDRLSQQFTDIVGWDTNTKTRAQMLDTLEQSLRDGGLSVHGERTLDEMAAFATPERVGDVGDYRSPRAQKGAHDDLVISLAIAVTVAARLPKNYKLPQAQVYEPVFEATGF